MNAICACSTDCRHSMQTSNSQLYDKSRERKLGRSTLFFFLNIFVLECMKYFNFQASVLSLKYKVYGVKSVRGDSCILLLVVSRGP
jgi:hypothetical protein